MKLVRIIYCLVFVFFLLNPKLIYCNNILEKSSFKKPIWISEIPKGKHYIYYSGLGSSDKSLQEAKDLSISNILSEIIMSDEIIAHNSFKSVSIEKNDSIFNYVKSEIEQTGKSTKITGLSKEEEYWQIAKSNSEIKYQYWMLMKVPKNSNFQPSQIKQGYGIAPVFKSILIPGWGQFHKKEHKKGWTFIVSESICLSSFAISNYLSNNYNEKANSARDIDNRNFYNKWSDYSYTFGTVSGIVGGVIYIYNIFDSITSKGEKQYAHINNNRINFYANSFNKQTGFTISINF